MSVKKGILKAIQLYRDLDAKGNAMAATMTLSDPLYIAADYAGMRINYYIHEALNYVENKIK